MQQLGGCDNERNIKFEIFHRHENGDLYSQYESITTINKLFKESKLSMGGET